MPLAGALGTGIITGLIGSGVQRVGSLAFQKLVRISRIDSALKGSAIKSASVQTAIIDFETVIGTRYGELNQKLYEFLRELERSGIINAMVENALIDRKSTEIERIFCDLHLKLMGAKAGAPADLFDKMTKSFTVTLEELSKDKILLEAFRLFHNDLELRLDRIDQALIELSKAPEKKSTPLPDLQQTFLRVARALQAINRSIRVETNKGARSVDITRIFIPSKLRYRDTKRNLQKMSAITRILGSGPQRSNRATPLDVRQELAQEQLAVITYNDLRLSFNRVVVLGDPGGGKSTLCQYLCHDLARQAAASLQTESTRLTAQLQKFPIRVILRVFEKARTLEPQLTIYDFILREMKNHVSASDREIEEALNYLLASGSAILAFDGLDEILATAQRRDFVDLVGSFCNQFPLCPAIVTSRLVGYDDAPLPPEFDELILEKFDDNEVRSYVHKFMKVVGGHDDKEAQHRANNFYRQTTNNAADLRRNPLMLGLMAWLFNMRGDVPSNRPEIYRECAVLMFEKWDPDRDIKANIPANFDRLQLFSDIAAKIFGDPELRAGVEASWLEKEVKAFFQEIYENKAQAFEAAKALVAFITGRAWVMSEVGDKVFAFTHQTFLEYFFARHIDDMRDTVREILDLIMPKVLVREWDMVSHLSLQIKTHRNLRRQNEALDELRAMMLTGLESKQRAALISFVSRALEYLAGAESHIKPVATIIVDYAIDCALDANTSAWKDVSQCAQCCIERRQFLRDIIVKRLADEFRRDESDRLRVIHDAISQFDNQDQFAFSEQQKLPADLASSVREELKSFIVGRLRHSAFHAANAWEWYGIIDKSLMLKHGIATYFNTRIGDYDNIDGFSAIALAASRHVRIIVPEHTTRQKARDALTWIGEIGFVSMPLKRDHFRTSLDDGISLAFWDDLLRHETEPDILVGYLFAMMAATELQNRTVSEPRFGRTKKKQVTRDEIIGRALGKRELQKLKLFPQIKAAYEAQSLFA